MVVAKVTLYQQFYYNKYYEEDLLWKNKISWIMY